jgi:hypothetical protein
MALLRCGGHAAALPRSLSKTLAKRCFSDGVPSPPALIAPVAAPARLGRRLAFAFWCC